MVTFLILVTAWLLIIGFLELVTLNSLSEVFALRKVFLIC